VAILPYKPGFYIGPVHVRFFYGNGSTEPGFSASIVLWLFPIRIITPVLYTHLHLNSQICLVGCIFLLMLHFFSGIRIKIHTKELLISHFSLIKWAGSLLPATHLVGLEKHLLGYSIMEYVLTCLLITEVWFNYVIV
jgi:hypothetical protein